MSQFDMHLAKWVSARFTQKEPCRMIVIARFPDNTTLGTINIDPGKAHDAIVDEIRDTCNADAHALGGFQKYQVRAIHGQSDRIFATLAYACDGGMPEQNPEAAIMQAEDPSPRGERAMNMRHTDTVFRYAAGATEKAIRIYEKNIDSQAAEIAQLRAENEQMRKELRDIRDEDHEKARQRRRDAWLEQKKDEVFDMLAPVLPMMAMGLGKKVFPQLASAPTGIKSEAELQIEGIFSTMSDEQLMGIMNILDPGQKMALMPLAKKFLEEREAKAAALAQKQAEFEKSA